MEEKLIEFPTAELAKKVNYNIFTTKVWIQKFNKERFYTPSFSGISNGTVWFRPTQSLLQKWLRKLHNISVCVDFRHSKTSKIEGINSVYYDVNIYTLSGGDAWKTIKLSQISDDYEIALEIGLQEALKLIKS